MTLPILKSSKIKDTNIASRLSDAVAYLEKCIKKIDPIPSVFIWFPAGLIQSKADSKTTAAQHKSVSGNDFAALLCPESTWRGAFLATG